MNRNDIKECITQINTKWENSFGTNCSVTIVNDYTSMFGGKLWKGIFGSSSENDSLTISIRYNSTMEKVQLRIGKVSGDIETNTGEQIKSYSDFESFCLKRLKIMDYDYKNNI